MKVFNITVLFFSIAVADAFSTSNKAARQSSQLCAKSENVNTVNRRSILATAFGAALGVGMSFPEDAAAAQTDCMSDCLKNCKLIAPKDPGYCLENCKSYCAQEDRTDGLSGSISSDGGEVGILGRSTVVKGEDKPPSLSLPGLDFSSDKGRKLIGY